MKPSPRMLLEPGDRWTTILDEPLVIDFEDGAGERPPRPGDIIGKWFSTDEPGRDFRVVSVSVSKSSPNTHAYELEFIGFQYFAVRG